LRYFSYRGAREPGWMSALTQETLVVEPANAYRMQIEHFAAVALRETTPLVSAEEGLRTLEATLAVKQAALSGRPVLVAGEAGKLGGPETERT
jgi:predicted dehydrogenase